MMAVMPLLTRIYPDTVESRFPGAIAAIGLTEDEVEQTDYNFYVQGDDLYCESSDERLAFRWFPCAPVGEWNDMKWPLKRD